MKNKRGDSLQQNLIYIIILVLVISLFMLAIYTKGDTKALKKQVLEKQTALMIDSAIPGTEIILRKQYINGYINNILIQDSRIFVSVDGLKSLDGYPLITEYHLEVEEIENKFVIKVNDEE
jgi:hypothetical protein